MASETPKKVMDEISKCFLCSSPSAAQERVFIFGNSAHNFVEIIRSSLDFDISCYANSKSASQHVIEKVMKVVSKEVAGLCSKTNPSLLRKTGKGDLENFDLEHVCSEWRERAPVFYSFLLTSAANKSSKSYTWFGSLALAGSVLLKQRNPGMSATASVIGVLLKSKAVEV